MAVTREEVRFSSRAIGKWKSEDPRSGLGIILHSGSAMILHNGSAIGITYPYRPPRRLICFASPSITSEKLRSQLDRLHSEAETTRAKANNARLRLLRLSEAADNLRRQAAISVRTGKEDDARELLFQKKKVMAALNKSKSRIELLDQLSTKLNEAISIKESQLIGNIALDLEEVSHAEAASKPVRIVSIKPEVAEHLDEDLEVNQDLQLNSERSIAITEEQEGLQSSQTSRLLDEDQILFSLKEISSFKEFLEHLERQLNRIELELTAVLKVSTLILDSGDEQKNVKVHQTVQVLEGIRDIRQRISGIKEGKLDT